MRPFAPTWSDYVLPAFVGMLVLCGFATGTQADVVVLANRMDRPVLVQVQPLSGQATRLTLSPGEVTPFFNDGQVQIDFASGTEQRRYRLDANSAYFFGRTAEGRIGLQKIGLGDDGSTAKGRSLPGSANARSAVIPVKILVDEDEPARQHVWERRLRQRVEAASEILDRHCRVQLKIVAVDTWITDNSTTDFVESLSEFERQVKPFPAQLAIGFSSQYVVERGRFHMAGTRGPLYTHILVREASPRLTEAERLEFLVHELGHFLGAAHSPERDSVMRPVLGDKLAGRHGFEIRFDPVNTLVIGMIGEEMRRRNIRDMAGLTTDTKRRLQQIYSELARAFPGDTSGDRFVQLVEAATTTPMAQGTKSVLNEIVRAALANRSLPMSVPEGSGRTARREGDALTEFYVREAARAAAALPEDVGPNALILALGIGLDDSDTLRTLPKTANFVRAVENVSQRATRLSALGQPTMRDRRDLTKHFAVAAYLATVLGKQEADAAGMAKELLDAKSGTGFSFADVAANRAGIQFADGVIGQRFSLQLLSNGFSVDAFMPSIDGLPEGLTAGQVLAQFGAQDDDRFREQLREIDRRVQQLPAYRLMHLLPEPRF